MFDLFNLLKRVASFEVQKDVCPASAPGGMQSAGSLRTLLFTEQPTWEMKGRAHYSLPCYASLP